MIKNKLNTKYPNSNKPSMSFFSSDRKKVLQWHWFFGVAVAIVIIVDKKIVRFMHFECILLKFQEKHYSAFNILLKLADLSAFF